MAITEKSYVDSNSGVKSARNKLREAQSKLSEAQLAHDRIPGNATAAMVADINKRLTAAQTAVAKAKDAVTAKETEIRDYFNKHKDTILASETAKSKAANAAGIADLEKNIATLKGMGQDTTALENRLAGLKNPKSTFKPSPGAGGTIVGDGQPVQVDDFAGLIKNARQDIKAMSPNDRLDIANKLLSIGIQVPKSGEFTDALVTGYTQLVSGAQVYYNANKEFPTVDAYLAEQQRQKNIVNPTVSGTGAVSKGGTTLQTSVSAKTEAAGLIQKAFQDRLGREATKQEIKDLTKQLTDAEKAHPNKTVTDAKGNVTYSGGIDRAQFLDDIIKALPEYATKKTAAAGTIKETLLDTSLNNNFTPTDSQMNTWVKRIQDGEKAETIQNEIRLSASTGYSDQIKKLMASGNDLKTVLSPYINTMASTLQLNPNTISLNDPVLHQAISTPDGKEMTLYQYQTALRKDPRWQYTDTARSEASGLVTKVLKDFGFMG